MASIQEVIDSLSQKLNNQQGIHPSPSFEPLVPQASPFMLHGQSEVAPPSIAHTTVSKDVHALIDNLKQQIKHIKILDSLVAWDDFDGIPVASLPAEFRMSKIDRYISIGYPHIHIIIYSTIMRAYGLDETQLIVLFPLSLSGVTQRWYASLDSSHHKTWEDLAQEFILQFTFNTVIDVSRRELDALRHGYDESVASFISRWREKIVQVIDRPTEREQIRMVVRRLQPKISRHVIGVPFTDFGSLVMVLFSVKDGLARVLSPANLKIPPLPL